MVSGRMPWVSFTLPLALPTRLSTITVSPSLIPNSLPVALLTAMVFSAVSAPMAKSRIGFCAVLPDWLRYMRL